MLDVIHFFFEDEFMSIQTGEQAEARDKAREILYSTFYNREYKHSTSRPSSSSYRMLDSELEIEDIPEPNDQFKKSRETKPYIPPTRMSTNAKDPFAGVLDSPLG